MRLVAVAALVAIGCGGPDKRAAEPEPPARAATAGDELLEVLPSGAQAIIEIDFARLRANPVVGPVLAALAEVDPERRRAWALAGGDLIEIGLALAIDAEVAVLASYRIGSPEAATLIAVRGGALDAAVPIRDDIRVAGPDGWIPRAKAAADGAAPALSGDRELLGARAVAMPAEATGAWLRVTAVLDFDARVSLASRFELDLVPATLSLWSDVADDLALVALVSGDAPGETRELGRALTRWRERLRRGRIARLLGLSGSLGLARIDGDDRLARVIFLISPGRLARVADRLVSHLRP